MLPIALSHLDHLRRHVDQLPAPLLQTPPAPLTHVELDLRARPTRILRPAEHAPRHELYDRIVVDWLARVAPYLGRHVTEERVRRSRHLEPDHVSPMGLVR